MWHLVAYELVRGLPGAGDLARRLADDGLTVKRAAFVQHYVYGGHEAFNAAAAYRAAGYAPKWAAVNGPKLLREPCVLAAVRLAVRRRGVTPIKH